MGLLPGVLQGPMHEQTLTVTLLAFQALCIGAGFVARHLLFHIWK